MNIYAYIRKPIPSSEIIEQYKGLHILLICRYYITKCSPACADFSQISSTSSSFIRPGENG